jgi:hypothetical protein
MMVYEHTLSGLILSLIVSASGIFAFSIHMYFIRKGREEFKELISQCILYGTLFISITQAVLTLWLLHRR